jgi:hypothetical protein
MKYLLIVLIANIFLLILLNGVVLAKSENFVSVRGDKFYLNGQEFYPYGTNYYPSYYNVPNFQIPAKDNRNQSFLSSPYYEDHITLLEKELQDLQNIGFNTIAFPAPHKNIPDRVNNFVDFLSRLKKHHLKASIALPACDPLSVGQNVKRKFILDECLSYIKDYSLANNDAVFAYEIAGESSWEDYNTRKNIAVLKDAWTNWIIERYGSKKNAGKSWGYTNYSLPSDIEMITNGVWTNKSKAYRRFFSDYVSKHYGEVVQEIKKIDPNHLVTARTGYTAGYQTLSVLNGAAKVVDFVGWEGWTLPNNGDTDLNLFNGNAFATEYAKAISGGKPVLYYEFGLDTLSDACHVKDRQFDHSCYNDNSSDKLNAQVTYYQHFYDMLIKSGASGVMNWMYVGKRPWKNFAYGDTEISDFGIREVPDNDTGNQLGKTKPVYNVVKKYASLFTQIRNFPIHSGTIFLDSDSFSNETDFWKKGGNEFAKHLQSNQFSTYISPGTGTNSLNTPMLCIGNIPYNGACPLKYLNAQFNTIQIQNVRGEWQDVSDGSSIEVTRNAPIIARASIKNIGESIWLSKTTDPRGKVQIGGNENFGSLKFRADIPANTNPNDDVYIDQFQLSSGIPTAQKVIMQMSSTDVAWFGEQVPVTLVPVASKNVSSNTTPGYIDSSPIIHSDSTTKLVQNTVMKQLLMQILLVVLTLLILVSLILITLKRKIKQKIELDQTQSPLTMTTVVHNEDKH